MTWAKEFEAAQRSRAANVVCMKWGTLYGPEWVNKLYGMVARNTTWNIRFACLTDDARGIRKEVECLPLPALALDRYRSPDGRGKDDPWWNKVSLYRKDLHDLTGMTLYLDLDVVVVGNIDDFFAYPGRFCMMPIWRSHRHSEKQGNSSVTRLFVGSETNIYERFISQPSANWEKMYSGDQTFVCASAEDLTFFPKEWCASFKDCLPRNAIVRYLSRPQIPPGAKIVVFFGANTPYAALKGEINPGKKWGAWKRLTPYKKRFRPAPWVAEYWAE